MRWIRKNQNQYFLESEDGKFRICKAIVGGTAKYTLWEKVEGSWADICTKDNTEDAKRVADDSYHAQNS